MIDVSAPTVRSHTPPPIPYRRLPWRTAVAGLLPLRWRGAAAERRIGRLPVLAVLVVFAAMVLALDNTVFTDEAALIQIGRDQLSYGLGAAATEPLHLRGAPAFYPVLAAVLDAFGGLAAVRMLSLCALLGTILLLRATAATATSSARFGLLSGAAFAFTAGAVYTGALATPDALCLLMLALALWCGVAGRTAGAGALCGGALAFAVALEYVALLLLPAVVLVIVLLRRWKGGGTWSERVQMALAATVVLTGLLAGLLLLEGPAFTEGLVVTTTAPGTLPAHLVDLGPTIGWLGLDLTVVGLLALAGTALAPRGARLLPVCVLVTGAVVPFVAMWAGGTTSANRLSAYSALLLAPLAGQALAALSRSLLRWVPVLAVLVVAPVLATAQSQMMFHGWVDVRPALAVVERHRTPGLYLSTASDTLRYYTRGRLDAPRWEGTSTLYAAGPDAVRGAVAARRYAMVILQPYSAAAPAQDALLDALNRSADYMQEGPIADTVDPEARWTVYRLLNTVP